MAWTAPRTYTAGEIVTAAILNADHRDNLKAIGDPWTAYTPTWTATTTNPTVGNGTIVGRWMSVGKLTSFSVVLTLGSTSTVGSGSYSLSLPTAALTQYLMFAGLFRDVSAGDPYPLLGEVNAAARDAVLLRRMPATAGNAFGSYTNALPVVPASTDMYVIGGTYEAA